MNCAVSTQRWRVQNLRVVLNSVAKLAQYSLVRNHGGGGRRLEFMNLRIEFYNEYTGGRNRNMKAVLQQFNKLLHLNRAISN